MTIESPSELFAGVVADRRRSRAAEDAEVFGLDAPRVGREPSATTEWVVGVGASASALEPDEVELTVDLIGSAVALLTDLGFTPYPVAAVDGATRRADFLLWISGTGTSPTERERLQRTGLPGITIGSPLADVDGWRSFDPSDSPNRASFASRLYEEVDILMRPDDAQALEDDPLPLTRGRIDRSSIVSGRVVTSDPVADMLTRIRNANTAMHETVRIPSSKLKEALAQVLKQEGYIDDFEVGTSTAGNKVLVISMKYSPERSRVISGLRTRSKLGLRIYARPERVPRALGGLGITVLSTSKGLMTDAEARKAGLGGEILCQVW